MSVTQSYIVFNVYELFPVSRFIRTDYHAGQIFIPHRLTLKVVFLIEPCAGRRRRQFAMGATADF